MPNTFLFADEAGDFTFKQQRGASNYFILCTFTTEDRGLSHELLHIRRQLALEGQSEREKLHATSDSQPLRDRVFACLMAHDFHVDATILEKRLILKRFDQRKSLASFLRFSIRNIRTERTH